MNINSKFKIGAISMVFFLSSCTQSNDSTNVIVDTKADVTMVKEVLKAYKSGIEALSVDGLSGLFMKNSEVYESGGVEGSFDHYLDHHLAPELKAFESFQFNDHKITVRIDLPYAFTTETYNYTIVVASDSQTISQKGVATSILKKQDSKWKILKTHTSARAKTSGSDH